MRLFFSLWPDEETRERIAALAARIEIHAGARRVPRENYHVTLAFIGEAGAADLATLREIGAAQRGSPCTIVFDCCEHWASSLVSVAAAHTTPPELADLSTGLYRDWSRSAPRERRAAPPPLRAHVTLARKVVQAPVLQDMSPFQWHAASFTLVRSDAGTVHSVYTVLDTWPLLYEPATS